ncbi:galectin-9 [Tachyglossus aculeatus]|uniref:galectin-9 n=1 Tax=Tachyglossus aculeatus TaxID=9261 RepID=UPI0018F49BD6|nr:galectin-9 [Tachyglossus aculeatus]
MAFSNLQSSFMNPHVPFSGSILGGLKDGLQIVINGTVLPTGSNGFAVNLQCGSSGQDIAFHFNPRFEGDYCVVCNTKENDRWGNEERKMEMPFLKGVPFEIRILVQSNSFLVAVNGNHFLEYQHRLPFQRADTITVQGSVHLAFINFQPQKSRPNPPIVMPQIHADYQMAGPRYVIPYSTLIVGGLYPSKTIIIWGTILPQAKRFHVNLRRGGDVAFHLNPRFDENTIVRNTQVSQFWGTEERSMISPMPFGPGQTITICIVCESHCFKVLVNGHHLFDYKHRLSDLQNINHLEIGGDIQVIHAQA